MVLTPIRLDTLMRIGAHERAYGRGVMLEEFASFVGLQYATASSRVHGLARLKLVSSWHTDFSRRCSRSSNASEHRLTPLGWQVLAEHGVERRRTSA